MTFDDAKRVCANKEVPIWHIRQMEQILSIIRRAENICPDRYMASLFELSAILSLKREQLCNERSFEMFRDYHFRFIAPLRHLNKRPSQYEPLPTEIVREQLHPEPRRYTVQIDRHNQALMAPIAVRHFFLAFGLQLSSQCKRNLLQNLETDERKFLTADDFAVLMLFDKETPVGELLSGDMERIDFDSALYLPQLEGERAEFSRLKQEQTVHLKTSASLDSSLFQLVTACQTKFKPIYDKLLMPVIKLSKLGYDYQGEGLSEPERAQLLGSKVKSWLGIVHVCEIFHKVVVISRQPTVAELTTTTTTTTTTAAPGVLGPAEGRNVVEVDRVERMTAEEVSHLDESEALGPTSSLAYEVSVLTRMEERLCVSSKRQLDLELSRKSGNGNPFGFAGLMRKTGNTIKRWFAKLDLMKFAHYRQNSLWYSGLLNFISSCSNVASIAVTLVFTASALG